MLENTMEHYSLSNITQKYGRPEHMNWLENLSWPKIFVELYIMLWMNDYDQITCVICFIGYIVKWKLLKKDYN